MTALKLTSSMQEQEYSATDTDLIDRLTKLLAMRQERKRPARRFDPELSYGRHRGPAGPGTRSAAVVALLYPQRGRWHLPLILRPTSMTDHAGQISLPGGRTDSGETAEQCALRELCEELGVPPKQVSVLGQLNSILVFASNYCVVPLVATCATRPQFHPNPSEVEELFEVPLAHILDVRRCGHCLIEHGKLRFRAPGIVLGERHIWGATGVILGDLLQLLES